MTETEKLEQAMAALEAQRSLLGDDVVNAALGPLRERLLALQTPVTSSPLVSWVTSWLSTLSR